MVAVWAPFAHQCEAAELARQRHVERVGHPRRIAQRRRHDGVIPQQRQQFREIDNRSIVASDYDELHAANSPHSCRRVSRVEPRVQRLDLFAGYDATAVTEPGRNLVVIGIVKIA